MREQQQREEAAEDQGWRVRTVDHADRVAQEVNELREQLAEEGEPSDDGHSALEQIRRTIEQARAKEHT